MFIGEIGINHNGDLRGCKRLIASCKASGVDIVKFQKRNPDVCVPDNKKDILRETPWGTMRYIDYKKKIEFGKEEFDEIDKFCNQIGIEWTSSVWDIDSLEFILNYDVPFIKIPSAMVTNKKLLRKIKSSDIPVIMSTGMSTKKEIKDAVDILSGCDLSILHCNSSYPCADEEINLKTIQTLKKEFPNHTIGYSGHESGILPSVYARAAGADIIERHVTLDRNMWGTDQSSSLEPIQLKKLINRLWELDRIMGDGKIKVYDSEKEIKAKLRK